MSTIPLGCANSCALFRTRFDNAIGQPDLDDFSDPTIPDPNQSDEQMDDTLQNGHIHWHSHEPSGAPSLSPTEDEECATSIGDELAKKTKRIDVTYGKTPYHRKGSYEITNYWIHPALESPDSARIFHLRHEIQTATIGNPPDTIYVEFKGTAPYTTFDSCSNDFALVYDGCSQYSNSQLLDIGRSYIPGQKLVVLQLEKFQQEDEWFLPCLAGFWTLTLVLGVCILLMAIRCWRHGNPWFCCGTPKSKSVESRNTQRKSTAGEMSPFRVAVVDRELSRDRVAVAASPDDEGFCPPDEDRPSSRHSRRCYRDYQAGGKQVHFGTREAATHELGRGRSKSRSRYKSPVYSNGGR